MRKKQNTGENSLQPIHIEMHHSFILLPSSLPSPSPPPAGKWLQIELKTFSIHLPEPATEVGCILPYQDSHFGLIQMRPWTIVVGDPTFYGNSVMQFVPIFVFSSSTLCFWDFSLWTWTHSVHSFQWKGGMYCMTGPRWFIHCLLADFLLRPLTQPECTFRRARPAFSAAHTQQGNPEPLGTGTVNSIRFCQIVFESSYISVSSHQQLVNGFLCPQSQAPLDISGSWRFRQPGAALRCGITASHCFDLNSFWILVKLSSTSYAYGPLGFYLLWIWPLNYLFLIAL